ncbi:MAG TPA: energy transducer TonB [Burkholderiales bacterium]|jgi:protein TonB|nr:energy transducer TonB [Burkholderiales bacterium]
MSYAEPHDSGRRFTGLAVVVVLHVVLGYALVEGLARKIVEVVRQPLETKIVEEVKPPPPEKPPPPPPKLSTPPPPYIPPPEVQVQVPVQAPTITAVTPVKPAEPVPPPAVPAPAAPEQPRTPVKTAAVVDARACEKPPYPAAALRANETGVVQLSFLIDVDGKVLESSITRSSGSRRLDEAARQGLSLCKFKPGTVDGKPERSRARIEYEWKIE